MISLVTRLPMTLEGYYPLSIHQRNFRSMTLSFERDAEALDVFESVRALTVTCTSHPLSIRVASVHQLPSVRDAVVCVLLYTKPTI